MNKSIKQLATILSFLVLTNNLVFSQTTELYDDIQDVKLIFPTAKIEGNVFSVLSNMQSISVNNLNSKNRIEKKVYDLNSKVHNLSNLRNNYRDQVEISKGRVVNGNVQFLIQSIGNDDKVNLTRTTVDENLNVVDEKLILSYDLAHTQNSGPVYSDREFKYDEKLNLYFYGEYYAVPKKDDYLRTVIFNSEMEIVSDNEFYVDNRDTELNFDKGKKYIKTAKIIDEETVILNFRRSLYRIKNKKFEVISVNFKNSIYSYKINSTGKGGFRLIGFYKEKKEPMGFAVIDFDVDMKVTKEKYQPIPDNLNASQKELTGKGYSENKKSRSFYLLDFNINADGSTDIVFYLKGFVFLNYSFLKIDDDSKVIDQLVVPYSTKQIAGHQLAFKDNEIVLICRDNEEWFDMNGDFNASGFPNRKSNSYIFAAIVVSSKDYKDFSRRIF